MHVSGGFAEDLRQGDLRKGDLRKEDLRMGDLRIQNSSHRATSEVAPQGTRAADAETNKTQHTRQLTHHPLTTRPPAIRPASQPNHNRSPTYVVLIICLSRHSYA